MNVELSERVEAALRQRAGGQGVSVEELAREAITRYLEQDGGLGDSADLPLDQAVDDGMSGETAAEVVPHRDWHDMRHGHEADSPIKHQPEDSAPRKQHGDKLEGVPPRQGSAS